MKDIFISHAWGKDELDRDNHERCKILANKLINNGYIAFGLIQMIYMVILIRL